MHISVDLTPFCPPWNLFESNMIVMARPWNRRIRLIIHIQEIGSAAFSVDKIWRAIDRHCPFWSIVRRSRRLHFSSTNHRFRLWRLRRRHRQSVKEGRRNVSYVGELRIVLSHCRSSVRCLSHGIEESSLLGLIPLWSNNRLPLVKCRWVIFPGISNYHQKLYACLSILRHIPSSSHCASPSPDCR